MNRAQRRALHRQTSKGVLLEGGPMDGYVVKPGAPALRPDWYEGYVAWLETFLAKPEHPPGQYVQAGPIARWVEYQSEAPSSGHGAVPELPEAGGEEGQV